ncbi:MAG: hypothetical protein ACFFBD_03535 [Candidatus Hodarchaeota archaeon]
MTQDKKREVLKRLKVTGPKTPQYGLWYASQFLSGFTMFPTPVIGGSLVFLTKNMVIVFLIRFIFLIGAFFPLLVVREPEIPMSLVQPM